MSVWGKVCTAVEKKSGAFHCGKPDGTGWDDGVDQEQALFYLSRDPLLHMNMIDSIRRGDAELLGVLPRGVLLRDRPSEALMMSAADASTAARLLETAPPAELFVAHQPFFIPEARAKYAPTHEMVCRQAVYQGVTPLPERPGFELRTLDETFLPFLMEHYTHADDEAYLLDRLRVGVMVGAFDRGRLMGFIGMHAERSIGFLEVLPAYRRRGVAYALETHMVNVVLAEGRVPFAQIVVGNEASLALHRKLGFAISEAALCWLIR